jgi:bacterioferritin-associated ferredoxin
MPLNLDDIVCYCFRVSRRKIETFCRIEKPATASELSDCLSAGTGCGWCRPTLRAIHLQIRSEAYEPRLNPNAGKTGGAADPIDAAAYAAARRAYLANGKGKPPPGALE